MILKNIMLNERCQPWLQSKPLVKACADATMPQVGETDLNIMVDILIVKWSRQPGLSMACWREKAFGRNKMIKPSTERLL